MAICSITVATAVVTKQTDQAAAYYYIASPNTTSLYYFSICYSALANTLGKHEEYVTNSIHTYTRIQVPQGMRTARVTVVHWNVVDTITSTHYRQLIVKTLVQLASL